MFGASRRELQGGLGEITVGIFLILAVTSSIVAASVYNSYKNKLLERDYISDLIAKAQQDQSELTDIKRTIGKPLGKDPAIAAEGILPTENVARQVASRRDIYLPVVLSDELSQGWRTSRLYSSLSDILALASARLGFLKSRHDRLLGDKAAIEKRIAIIQNTLPNMPVSKIQFKAQVDSWTADVKSKIAMAVQSYESGKNSLVTARNDLEEKINIEQNNLLRATQTLRSQIARNLSKLRELLKTHELIKFVPHEHHGKISSVNIQNMSAYINLGSRNRVREGMIFLVSKPTSIGVFHYKGKVVVKRIWLDFSEVEIKAQYNEKEPLLEGDILVNPFFHKDREVVIAFSGKNMIEGSTMTMNEAKKRAIEFGCRVISPREIKLSDGSTFALLPIDLDYLVYAGPLPTEPTHRPEYLTALELGIPVADPKELVKFLQD